MNVELEMDEDTESEDQNEIEIEESEFDEDGVENGGPKNRETRFPLLPFLYDYESFPLVVDDPKSVYIEIKDQKNFDEKKFFHRNF